MTLPLVISPGDPGHIGDHEEIGALLAAAGTPFIAGADAQGTHAGRPVAGTAGRYYYETDTGLLFRDNGATWVAVNLLTTEFQTYSQASTLTAVPNADVTIATVSVTLPATWGSMDVIALANQGMDYIGGTGNGFRRVNTWLVLDGATKPDATMIWEQDTAGTNFYQTAALFGMVTGKAAAFDCEFHARCTNSVPPYDGLASGDSDGWFIKLRKS